MTSLAACYLAGMKRAWIQGLLVAGLAGLLGASGASADDDAPLEVSLTPLVAPAHHEGPVRHEAWRRVLTLRSTRGQEVVRDRRLLEIEVRPEGSRRRLRCRHPDAPRRVDEGRVARMEAGDRYQEWVDLRMYCSGRARDALAAGGATLKVRYGFRRRSRRQWIARQEDERRPAFRADAELTWTAPVPEAPATNDGASRDDASQDDASQEAPETTPDVRVSLSDQTTRATPRLVTRVRGSGRAYLRDDQWSFRISGPLGDAVCEVPRARIVPIVDFFSRLNSRGRRETLDAGRYCPEDSFAVAGVYEVTPLLTLVHDGEEFELEAHTGTFTGEPAVFRIRRRAYVEQSLEDLFPRPDAETDDE